MGSIRDMRNLGEKTAGWLRDVGIETDDDLREVGAVEAYLWLKTRYRDKVSLNALWGLQAALLDIHWQHLSDEMKAELRAEVEAAEQSLNQDHD